MLDVFGKDCFEVTAAEGEHPVDALAPDGAHDALADRVGTRCPDGGRHDPGALGNEDGIEGGGFSGCSVPPHRTNRTSIHPPAPLPHPRRTRCGHQCTQGLARSAAAAWAVSSASSVLAPRAVTCPSFRPGRVAFPYRWT